MDNSWYFPTEGIRLDIGEVHLWLISLLGDDKLIQEFTGIISQEERDRAERFNSQSAKIGFILGRGHIHQILSSYLDVNPANIQFEYSLNGKPEISNEYINSDLQFNYSQSRNLGLIGITKNRCIGVDIEKISEDMDFQPVAHRFFTPNELGYLSQLPEDTQRIGFFRIWAAIEAYLKAIGIGLSRSFSQLDIALPKLEEVDHYSFQDQRDRMSWLIQWVSAYPGYISAVTVPGHIDQLKLFQYGKF